MKKILVSLLLLCSCYTVNAQTDQINHDKYWFYRYRLLTEFMVKGESACGKSSGLSIPAGGAFEGQWNATGDRTKDVSTVSVHFGDGTSHLGYYMGVLASEHKILREHGGAASQLKRTEEELYMAMKAYERLDRNAEVLLAPRASSDCNSTLNGFFLRDDVNDSFKYKLKRPYTLTGVNPNTEYRNVTSDYQTGVGRNTDQLVGKDALDKPFNSSDQMSDLFVGFALVRKLMAGYNYNGYAFSENAKLYTQAIMDKLKSNNYTIKLEGDGRTVQYGGIEAMVNSYPFAKAGQRIYHDSWGKQTIPDGDWENAITFACLSDVWARLNYPEGTLLYEQQWKGNEYNNAIIGQLAAVGNSWDMGFTPARIVNQPILLPWLECPDRTDCAYGCILCSRLTGCIGCRNYCITRADLNNCKFATTNVEVWCYTNTLTKVFTDAALVTSVLGPELAIALGTPRPGSKGWLGAVVGGALPLALAVVPDVQLCAPFRLPKLTVNTTALALSEYGWKYNNQLFPLLHKVLHNQGNYTYSPSGLKAIIDSAPCTGPHAHPVDDPYNLSNAPGVYGWQVDNRFQKANFANYKDPQGAWPGLDYMLLYNLWLLEHGDFNQIGQFIDKMNVVIDNKAYNGETEKTTASSSIESIRATVNAPSKITYTAKDVVKLKPGFAAKSGSTLKLYIASNIIPCATTNTGLQKIAHDSSTEISKIDSSALAKSLADGLTSDLKAYQEQVKETQKQYEYRPAKDFVKENTVRADGNMVSAYPNPTSSIVNIEMHLSDDMIVEICIKDQVGEIVGEQIKENALAGSYTNTLDLSNLKSGLYFLTIKTGEETNVKKIFKQ